MNSLSAVPLQMLHGLTIVLVRLDDCGVVLNASIWPVSVRTGSVACLEP